MNLATSLGRITLSNPVVLASGTCGYGREIAPFLNLNEVGALTVKSLSVFPWDGNPPPRIRETYAGLMNSIGLENKGVYRFLEEDLPFLEELATRVFVGIWGRTVEEYVAVARAIEGAPRIDALEVNVSCPNVEKGGATFLEDEAVLQRLLAEIRSVTGKFLIVKVGPQVRDWRRVVSIFEREGVEAISVTNSFPALSVDVEQMDFFFPLKFAGLSGPAIKPLALRMVYEVLQVTALPVIGMGGIVTASDALEFLLLGARAVGLGSCTLVDPSSALRVLEGLRDYLTRKRIGDINSIIGKVR
ncbi:MAG: dihydroorotate dehydrogenase [Candidatus Caldatribacteriaceae bacterium]